MILRAEDLPFGKSRFTKRDRIAEVTLNEAFGGIFFLPKGCDQFGLGMITSYFLDQIFFGHSRSTKQMIIYPKTTCRKVWSIQVFLWLKRSEKHKHTKKTHTPESLQRGLKIFSPKKPTKKRRPESRKSWHLPTETLHLCMAQLPSGHHLFMTRRRMRQKRLERRISKSRWPVGPLGWVVDEDFGPGGSEELKVLCCC